MRWIVVRLAVGLASLTGLALVVVGFPVGIVVAFRSPIPSSAPAVHSLWTGLTDDQIRTIAGWACWLLWSVAAATVLEEVAAYLRKRAARRLRIAGPLQPVVAQLVAWCALTFAPAPPRHVGVSTDRQALTAVLARSGPATAPAVAPRGTSAPERVHVVLPGESAWAIAGEEARDPSRWPEMWNEDRGLPQPDGGRWTDPNLIYPRWRLPIPPDWSPSAARPAAPTNGAPAKPPPAHASPPAGDDGPLGPPRRSSEGSSSTPSTVPPRPVPHRTPGPSIALPTRRSAPATPHGPSPRGGVLDLPSGGVVAAWFAVGIGTAVALGRLHRRRRYRPGAPRPGLGARPSERLGRLPAQLRQVQLGGWVDDEAEDHTRTGDAPPAPPSFETGRLALGEVDGRLVSVDVLALQGIGVVGAGAEDMLRALAIDIALRRQECAGLLLTATVQNRLGLGGLEAHPGVRVAPTIEELLRELEVATVTRTGFLDRYGAADMRSVLADDPGEPTPVLLALTEAPDSDARLRAILATGPRLAIGAALLGEWRSGVTVEVDGDHAVRGVAGEGARGDHLGLSGARAVALSAQDARESVAVIRQSYGEDAAADGLAVGEPSEADSGAAEIAEASTGADMRDAADIAVPDGAPLLSEPPVLIAPDGDAGPRPVRVALLGGYRIDANATGEIKNGLRAKARELFAFLLLHPHGVTRDAVVDTLWQHVDADRATNQLYTVLGNLRSALRTATGLTTASFIDRIGEQYRVDPALVDTDLWRFEAAVLRANASGVDREAIAGALEEAETLFAGDPLDGMSYGWAEPVREDIRARAVTAITRLADLHEPTDPDRTADALEAALRIDPYSETLYQRLLRLLAARGRRDDVRRVWRQACNRLDEIDLDPDEETESIVAAALRPGVASTSRGND